MRKSEKQKRNGEPSASRTKVERDDDLEDDVDALFRLPLPEFTGARNTLAARLKKSGRGDEAFRVKALEPEQSINVVLEIVVALDLRPASAGLSIPFLLFTFS